METFTSFYFSFKTQVSHLTKLESIAITNDTFIRSILARIINVDELKEATKKFLKCGTKDYEEILQDILSDFRAQESASTMKKRPLANLCRAAALMQRPASAPLHSPSFHQIAFLQ